MQAGPAAGYGAPMGVGAPMGMGGSFLGTAASTAAGVIGGGLLLGGIRSMMGHSGAHAAVDPSAHGALDAAKTPPPSGSINSEESCRKALADVGFDEVGAQPIEREWVVKSVRDLLAGAEWTWHIGRNYVELPPGKSHVLKVVR